MICKYNVGGVTIIINTYAGGTISQQVIAAVSQINSVPSPWSAVMSLKRFRSMMYDYIFEDVSIKAQNEAIAKEHKEARFRLHPVAESVAEASGFDDMEGEPDDLCSDAIVIKMVGSWHASNALGMLPSVSFYKKRSLEFQSDRTQTHEDYDDEDEEY